MKFRPGQLIKSKSAAGRVIGYDHTEWLPYIEFCKRDFGNARYVGTIHELTPIPALMLGEAIQIPYPSEDELYVPESAEQTYWIEILYGERRLVVPEESFEAL